MFLKEHYPQCSYSELAVSLNRTIGSIARKLTEIGLIGASKKMRSQNKQSYHAIGSRRRASNRYNGILSRCRQSYRKKNKHYREIKIIVSREEFIEWFMPQDFDGASVDRIDKNGDYELPNMQVISLADNIRKDKVKAKDGLCECYSCHQIKPLFLFTKDKRRANGYSTLCLECEKQRKGDKYKRLHKTR